MLKESKLRQLIRHEVREAFGFSAKEKYLKFLNQIFKKAEGEISKFDANTLFQQPSKNPDNAEYLRLVKIRLSQASQILRTIEKINPDLFVVKSGTGAASCLMKYNSVDVKGIIPSNFSFIMQNGYIDKEKAKQGLVDILKDVKQKFTSDNITSDKNKMKEIVLKLTSGN